MFPIRRVFSSFVNKFIAYSILSKTKCKKAQSFTPYVAYDKNSVCPVLDVDIGFNL